MRLYIYIVLLSFATTLAAENMKVIGINHGTIMVNGKKIEVSSVFDSSSRIVWSDDKQILKVIGMESHKIKIYAAQTFKIGQVISIDELLIQKQRLSSRDGILRNAYDFQRLFDRDIALLNVFPIETGYTFDDNHFLFLRYEYNNETINKRLFCSNHTTIFNDSIFYVDGKLIEQQKIVADLYYYNANDELSVLLASNIIIDSSPRQHVIHFLEPYINEDLSLEELSELVSDFCQIRIPGMKFISFDIISFLQKWKLRTFR